MAFGYWAQYFLCTTGAEAFIATLAIADRGNIRISWILCKICSHHKLSRPGRMVTGKHKGQTIYRRYYCNGFNPFYGIMPEWFKMVGIVIATIAAIIASQALIRDHLHLSVKLCG